MNKKPNQLNFRPCWVLTKLIPGHVAKCEFPYVTGRNFHKIILLIFLLLWVEKVWNWSPYGSEIWILAFKSFRFEEKNIQVNFHDIFQFFQLLFVNFADIHLIWRGSGESLISNYSARLPSFLRQDERTRSPNIAFTFTTCAHLWKCQTTCFYVTSKRLCFSHDKINI